MSPEGIDGEVGRLSYVCSIIVGGNGRRLFKDYATPVGHGLRVPLGTFP